MQAYKAAAEDALNRASVAEIELTKKIELKFEYSRTPEAMRLVKDFELQILEQSFEESCHLTAHLKLRLEDSLQAQKEYLKSIGIVIVDNN